MQPGSGRTRTVLQICAHTGYHGLVNANREEPQKRLILALVCVGTFMSTLDASIINVAMPTLSKRFAVDVQVSQWFVLVYNLVVSVLLLTVGRLGDIFGRKRIYSFGVAAFSAGSLACGLSGSALGLIVSRAFQAVGASAIMSNGPALVTETAPASERGKSLGLIGTAVALGLLAGPVFGGAILQHAVYPSPGESWRWMFLINVPIGAVLIVLLVSVRRAEHRSAHRIDVPGAVLLALCVCAFVLGLNHAADSGWDSTVTGGAVLLACALAAMFVWFEKRARNPMLDIGLFRNSEFSIGTATGWANYAASMPVGVFLPFYLQGELRLTPQAAGLVLAAGPLTVALVAPLAGALSDKIGSRALTVTGLAVAGGGMLLLRALAAESAWPDVVWRLAVASFGSALFVSPNSSSVMGSVPAHSLGVAGGVVALVRNLGMVFGVALAAAIIASVSGGYSLEGLKAALLSCAAISFLGSAVSTIRTGRPRPHWRGEPAEPAPPFADRRA